MFVTGLTAPESEEGASILDSSRTKPRVENPSIHGKKNLLLWVLCSKPRGEAPSTHGRKKSFYMGPVFCVGIVAWVSTSSGCS